MICPVQRATNLTGPAELRLGIAKTCVSRSIFILNEHIVFKSIRDTWLLGKDIHKSSPKLLSSLFYLLFHQPNSRKLCNLSMLTMSTIFTVPSKAEKLWKQLNMKRTTAITWRPICHRDCCLKKMYPLVPLWGVGLLQLLQSYCNYNSHILNGKVTCLFFLTQMEPVV